METKSRILEIRPKSKRLWRRAPFKSAQLAETPGKSRLGVRPLPQDLTGVGLIDPARFLDVEKH